MSRNTVGKTFFLHFLRATIKPPKASTHSFLKLLPNERPHKCVTHVCQHPGDKFCERSKSSHADSSRVPSRETCQSRPFCRRYRQARTVYSISSSFLQPSACFRKNYWNEIWSWIVFWRIPVFSARGLRWFIVSSFQKFYRSHF